MKNKKELLEKAILNFEEASQAYHGDIFHDNSEKERAEHVWGFCFDEIVRIGIAKEDKG